jgi:hypothetical protein
MTHMGQSSRWVMSLSCRVTPIRGMTVRIVKCSDGSLLGPNLTITICVIRICRSRQNNSQRIVDELVPETAIIRVGVNH